MTKEQYLAAVDQTKEHIQAGDVFQLVLSQRFQRHTLADPFEIYRYTTHILCLRGSSLIGVHACGHAAPTSEKAVDLSSKPRTAAAISSGYATCAACSLAVHLND